MAWFRAGLCLLDILCIAGSVLAAHNTSTLSASVPTTVQPIVQTDAQLSVGSSIFPSTQTGASVNTSTPPTTKAPPKYRTVCYDHVGCFSNAPPFDNANKALPLSPQKVGTKFHLYTNRDPSANVTYFIDYVNITSLNESRFNPAQPIKFVIHGFANDISTEWPYTIKNELLKKEDMNVIMVSWGPGALSPNYPQAVANTRMVAAQTKLLILNMAELGASYESMHLIGHSLGAHTSGHVGQMMKQLNATIGRITGMDPADPEFTDHPVTVRLDKNDAAFVDVIHTNGAPLLRGGLGMKEQCGDVDFYVNGGLGQPGCPALFSSKNLDEVSCSHSRSHDVFAESINSDCPFTAYPCSSYEKFQRGECLSCGPQGCGTLGYYSDWYQATGKLYLDTLAKTPYCGHHYTVRVKMSSHPASVTSGQVHVQLNGTWGVSEWMQVTSGNQNLSPGGTASGLGITRQVIGRIKSINLKYMKSTNMLSFSNDSLSVHKINIQSGETGKRYSLCINKTFKTGEKQTVYVSNNGECAASRRRTLSYGMRAAAMFKAHKQH